jgi:carbon storage regulator CsrA
LNQAISHKRSFAMLVLTRKEQESIAIGGLNDGQPMVTVTVLEICGGRVRLGFEGDRSVFIHRSELWERIQARGAPEERKDDVAMPPARRNGHNGSFPPP